MKKRASSSDGAASSLKRIKLEVSEHPVDRARVRHLSGPALGAAGGGGSCVAYWMSRDQRADDNWALLYAQEVAIARQLPLAVVFTIVPEFLEATIRQFGFMIEGLRETESTLVSQGIPFFLLSGQPSETLPTWCETYKPELLVSTSVRCVSQGCGRSRSAPRSRTSPWKRWTRITLCPCGRPARRSSTEPAPFAKRSITSLIDISRRFLLLRARTLTLS